MHGECSDDAAATDQRHCYHTSDLKSLMPSSRKLPAYREVTASRIGEQALIHDGTPHPGDFPSWSEWLARAGANQAPAGGTEDQLHRGGDQRGGYGRRRRAGPQGSLFAQEIEDRRLVHLVPEVRWPVKMGPLHRGLVDGLGRYEVTAFHNWLASGVLPL